MNICHIVPIYLPGILPGCSRYIQDILNGLAIPVSEAAIIFVNGRHANPEDDLHHADTVSIFPPIGGG